VGAMAIPHKKRALSPSQEGRRPATPGTRGRRRDRRRPSPAPPPQRLGALEACVIERTLARRESRHTGSMGRESRIDAASGKPYFRISELRAAMRVTSKGPGHHSGRHPRKGGPRAGNRGPFRGRWRDGPDRPAKAGRAETRGQRAVRLLRGSGTVKMSTDEIMALTRGED
jgi:hypothetical protein